MFKLLQLYLTLSKEGLASISCQSIGLLVRLFMGEIEPANGGFTIQIHMATFAPILPVKKFLRYQFPPILIFTVLIYDRIQESENRHPDHGSIRISDQNICHPCQLDCIVKHEKFLTLKRSDRYKYNLHNIHILLA